MSNPNSATIDKNTRAVTVYDPKTMPYSLYGTDLTHLSDRQRVFVLLKSQGFSDADAFKGAGYQNSAVPANTVAVATHPKVLAAIEATVGGQIRAGAAAAIAYINKVVNDETLAPKLRVEAAKTILDRAGYLPPTRDERGQGDTLSEMTPDQLRAFINDAERKLSDKATIINGDAVATQSTLDGAEFLA